MDLAAAARVTQVLLELGLTVHSAMRHGRFVVKVTGGKTAAVGVGESFLEASTACLVALGAELALARRNPLT